MFEIWNFVMFKKLKPAIRPKVLTYFKRIQKRNRFTNRWISWANLSSFKILKQFKLFHRYYISAKNSSRSKKLRLMKIFFIDWFGLQKVWILRASYSSFKSLKYFQLIHRLDRFSISSSFFSKLFELAKFEIFQIISQWDLIGKKFEFWKLDISKFKTVPRFY